MNLNTFYRILAVPAFISGMAFFFTGCHPGALVKERIAGDAVAKKLHQTAQEHLENDQTLMALNLFNRMAREYPNYAEMPRVRYKTAKCLNLIGEYYLSNKLAQKWMTAYRSHPLKKTVMMLLGDNFEALENIPQAFYWFLEARKESFHDPQIQTALDERLRYLIRTSDIQNLDRLRIYASGTHYAARIRHRKAEVFLEHDELQKAKKIADSMVRDTADHAGVSAGMALLERIREELSVKKGLIGCLLPLSGPYAIYGEEVLTGIQQGIFNSSPRASTVELVLKDTKDDPNVALAALEKLAHNEKVIAVIGPLASKTAYPVAERAQALGVPLITLTQKEGVTEAGDMVFRNFLTPSREVRRVLNRDMLDRGIRRFAILYPDNSYGRFFMDLFWDRIEELGATVTAVETYPPDSTDFGEQIKKMIGVYYPKPKRLREKLQEMRPPEELEYMIYTEKPEPFIDFDAVFIPDNFHRISMIVPQLPYYDVTDVQLMGTSLWQSQEIINMAGNYMQDAVFPACFFARSTDAKVQSFVTEYQQNHGTTPGLLAAVGYDTLRLLSWIMDQEDVRTRKKVRNMLFSIRSFPGVTGDIGFDETGELQNPPLLLTIAGRKMVKVQ